MRILRVLSIFVLSALALGACNPLSAEEAAGTAEAATTTASSPTPSATHSPTLTDTPTLTPTDTPTPSDTPTETLTPTLTFTPTDPATSTPSKTPLPTATPIPPTITPCPSDTKIHIENRSGSSVTITLTGPCIYVLNLAPGNNTFNVAAGYYDYSIYMCGATYRGSFTFKAGGHYYVEC